MIREHIVKNMLLFLGKIRKRFLKKKRKYDLFSNKKRYIIQKQKRQIVQYCRKLAKTFKKFVSLARWCYNVQVYFGEVWSLEKDYDNEKGKKWKRFRVFSS